MLTACRIPVLLWERFWEYLDEDECLWAKQLSGDAVEDFQRTIERMIRVAIPTESKARLRDAWSSLGLEHPLSEHANPDLWSELENALDAPDYSADEDDAKSLLDLLWGSQLSETARSKPITTESVQAAQRFLMELKYAALCTLEDFRGMWSCFMNTLPREVLRELSAVLFTLTMLILLRELK